jgi:hypothetical protein
MDIMLYIVIYDIILLHSYIWYYITTCMCNSAITSPSHGYMCRCAALDIISIKRLGECWVRLIKQKFWRWNKRILIEVLEQSLMWHPPSADHVRSKEQIPGTYTKKIRTFYCSFAGLTYTPTMEILHTAHAYVGLQYVRFAYCSRRESASPRAFFLIMPSSFFRNDNDTIQSCNVYDDDILLLSYYPFIDTMSERHSPFFQSWYALC